MRRLALALLFLAGPAAAQPLRTLVIEPDAGVMVPPRGAPMPASRPVTTPMQYPALPPLHGSSAFALAPATGLVAGVAPAIGLAALAATALLGAGTGSVPGGGGGASAPARTR